MGVYLVGSSIRTQKRRTVMCPQRQRLACQCATVFHEVSFPSSRLNKNYQVLTAHAFCHVVRSIWSPLPANQVGDRTEDNSPPRPSTAVAMMNLFGIAPNSAYVRSGGIPRGTEEGPSTPGAVPVRDQTRLDGKTEVEDNPWDGYDAFRPDPPTRVKNRGKEKWICPQHGPMCNPGICKARGKVERDERWRKEREEREEAKQKRKEARETRARGRGRRRKPTRAEGPKVPRCDQPARLANGPRRGRSSSSSSSETEGDARDQGEILFEQANEININLTCIGFLTRSVALPYGKPRPSSSPANELSPGLGGDYADGYFGKRRGISYVRWHRLGRPGRHSPVLLGPGPQHQRQWEGQWR